MANIPDDSYKVKYLNETNKNILEIAKNIHSYTNNYIFNLLDEKNLENIIKNSNSQNFIKNDQGLSLFEKMNIIEENNKIIESISKEMINITDDSIIKHCTIFSNMNPIQLNLNEKKLFNNLDELDKSKRFNYICQIHNKNFISYCFICNKNLCEHCINFGEMHKGHNIINYSKIILNQFPEE